MNQLFTIEDAEKLGFEDDYCLYFAVFMNAVIGEVSRRTDLPFSALPARDWVAAFHSNLPISDIVDNYLKEIFP